MQAAQAKQTNGFQFLIIAKLNNCVELYRIISLINEFIKSGSILRNEDIKEYVGQVEIEQLTYMMMRGIKPKSKWTLKEWPNWKEKAISRTIWDENWFSCQRE